MCTMRLKKDCIILYILGNRGSWRKRIPDSKRFYRELFVCVECYKESVGHPEDPEEEEFWGCQMADNVMGFRSGEKGHEDPRICY